MAKASAHTHNNSKTLDKKYKSAVELYIKRVIETIMKKDQRARNTDFIDGLPEKLFDVYMHHDYCYLSRKQSLPYKNQIVKAFESAINQSISLPMFLDLGPGYHAALEREEPRHLSFDVGIGELLVLYQIKRFSDRVKEIYSPGAEFKIIIDNLCAVFVNDIDTRNTEDYCRKFRRLITEVGIGQQVALLVESELFSLSDYDVKPIPHDEITSTKLSDKDYDNVKRFLGRDTSMEDAVRRTLIYKQIGGRTDELFYRYFKNEVHMTQRTSQSTICFRPFPGGDSRIQSGIVVLGLNPRDNVYPFLLTSQNYDKYTYHYLEFPEILPKSINEVTFAEVTRAPH